MKWKVTMIILAGLVISTAIGHHHLDKLAMAQLSSPLLTTNDSQLHKPASSLRIHLTETEKFPPEFREVADYLSQQTTNANAYYVDIEPPTEEQKRFIEQELRTKDLASVVAFHFWHISAFSDENIGLNGNPGGNCYTRYYNKESRKFSNKYLWQ